MQVEYLIIDKNKALYYKGNKEGLTSAARLKLGFMTNTYMSENAQSTIGRIMRKIGKMMPWETLLRRVLVPQDKNNIPCENCIAHTERDMLELEETITPETTTSEILTKMSNISSN